MCDNAGADPSVSAASHDCGCAPDEVYVAPQNKETLRIVYAEINRSCSRGSISDVSDEEFSRMVNALENKEYRIHPYKFIGRTYTHLPSLVTALAVNWEYGKMHLYNSVLADAFENSCLAIGANATICEVEKQHTGNEDRSFWNFIYKAYPELEGFHWRGRNYASLSELGFDMLDKLRCDDVSSYPYWASILRNRLLSDYLSKKKPEDSDLIAAVSEFENVHEKRRSTHETLTNYYKVAYLLSGNRQLMMWGKVFERTSELAEYAEALCGSSYDEFEEFCKALIDDDGVMCPQFEAWLTVVGKKDELVAWQQSIES